MAEPSIEHELAAFVADTTTETECQTLARDLVAQPALRTTLAKQLFLDRMLATMAQPALNADVILRALPAQSRPLSGRVMDRITPPHARHWLLRPRYLAAAVLFVVLGVSYAFVSLRNPLPTGTPVAQVIAFGGNVILERNGARKHLGEKIALYRSDTVVTESKGWLTLRYNDGTELKFEPSTRLRLSTATSNAGTEQPSLEQGSFLATVAKQSTQNPMRFETAAATVDVLGTEFELALLDNTTTVSVREGRVRFTARASGESREIAAGERGNVGVAGALVWDYVEKRDPLLWPFASLSPWNHPLGSGAQYIPAMSPDFPLTRGAKVSLKLFGHPVFVAAPDDPERAIEKTNGAPLLRARIPLAAKPDPSAWGALHILYPNTRTALELTGVEQLPNGVVRTQDHAITDLNGMGFQTESIRVSGASGLGGLIRRGELRGGIRHALALAVIRKAIHRRNGPGTAFVWPASRAPAAYGVDTPGPRQLGTLLALPPDLDLSTLNIGSSGPAYEVARALQDYGGYVVESFQDASNDVNFFVEPAAEAELPVDFDVQLSRILLHLKIVSNNSPERIGGGGTPRRPFAPVLEATQRGADF